MRQVVILAGGKGTRLRERLGDLPKPLIDVCGTPLLERQITLAKRYQFNKVLILVNYRADCIVDFCKSRENWGVDIQCIDDGEPRGTAGAVLQILDQLEEEFLLMYGDTMLEVDLERFYQFHLKNNEAEATLFLHPNDHPHDSDLVDMDEDGHITGFHPYPHDTDRYYPNLVNAALYWMRKSALAPYRDTPGTLDFGKQLFPTMIDKGVLLRGYNSPEYIKDCGTPARIDKVCADFLSGKIARSALNHPQKAIFVDRDGTLNHEVDHLNSPNQLELLPGTEHAIRKLNRSEYRVCVVTNQPVVARGECTLDALHQIHNKLESLLGSEGAFVDRIYYCPHHPDSGFAGEISDLKIPCSCRKPQTGMIERAIAELNIERDSSWMVGDSTADILAAEQAGIKSILVETGYAGLDHKFWAAPNFIVPDFKSAVNFILEIYPALIQQLDPLLEKILPGDIVFVGGQSRSGKSSVASAMRDSFKSRGMRSHVISTDRWLLDENARGNSVLTRHAASELNTFLSKMLNLGTRPAEISLPGYLKAQRTHVPNIESIQLSSKDIIIVEGVVALHFASLVNAQHRFFVSIDERERQRRVIGEYIKRGFLKKNAQAIYAARAIEEVPWIAETSIYARHITVPTTSTN